VRDSRVGRVGRVRADRGPPDHRQGQARHADGRLLLLLTLLHGPTRRRAGQSVGLNMPRRFSAVPDKNGWTILHVCFKFVYGGHRTDTKLLGTAQRPVEPFQRRFCR
jgi:hypothetical protein